MSFYTSLNGLKNAQTELSVIANNLANAETTGFKKSRINFSDLVSGSAASNALWPRAKSDKAWAVSPPARKLSKAS